MKTVPDPTKEEKKSPPCPSLALVNQPTGWRAWYRGVLLAQHMFTGITRGMRLSDLYKLDPRMIILEKKKRKGGSQLPPGGRSPSERSGEDVRV